MITSISLDVIGPVSEADSNQVVPLKITATFTGVGESDTFTINSVSSVGGSLSVSPIGPFVGTLLSGIRCPESDVSMQSTRTVYVRPGQFSGIERVRVTSESVPSVNSVVDLEFSQKEEKEIGKFFGDFVFASTSSFLDLFEDRDVLRAFWHGMVLGGDDVSARTMVAEKSFKIFRMPVFSTRRWQAFAFSDETGGFDGRFVRFSVPADRDYGFSIDPDDDVNLAHFNTTDPELSLRSAGPTSFVLHPGTNEFDATDRSEINSLDSVGFHRSSNATGSGVHVRLLFDLRQSKSNLVHVRLQIDAKSWATGGETSSVIAEVWNHETETWDELGSSDAFGSDPGVWSQVGGVLHGDDLNECVDGDGLVIVRIRASAAVITNEVHLSIDRAQLQVGTINESSCDILSPVSTPVSSSDMNIELRSTVDGSVLDENVDYVVDFENERIVWLSEHDEPVDVLVIFDSEYPYVYEIDDDVVSVPELRREVLLTPLTRLIDSKDFTIRRQGQLRCRIQQHYSGSVLRWWAPTSLHDEGLIFKNFGAVTSRLEDERSSVSYLRRIQGLWFAFWSGPSIKNIESGAQILMNAPFAFDSSRVATIRGNEIILSSGQRAIKPATTPWAVSIGDQVSRFQPLTRGATIIDRVSRPGFLGGLFESTLIDELILDDDLPPAVARAVVEQHFFTASVDGYSLALGGGGSGLIKKFLEAIKPVHTYMGLGIILAADCGEVTEGPCGFETSGNCLCDIAPPPYDLRAEVGSYVELDVTEYLQRRPYLNEVLGTKTDLAELDAVVGQAPGDSWYVTDESSYYVWYEPQALPQPTVNLGRYVNDSGDWVDRVPGLHAGYQLQTWVIGDEEFVAADSHSAGQPPYAQWQWGGKWLRLIEKPFDLPMRTGYKSQLDLHDSPDTGTAEARFSGTAKDSNGIDIPGASGSTETDEPHRIGQGSPSGSVTIDSPPVTLVKVISNTSLGAEIPGSHFDVDLVSGRVTFDPEFEYNPITNPDGSWADGHDVLVTYRSGFIIDDRFPGESGYLSAKSYSERGLLEEPSTVSEPWSNYDEAYDLDGDMPSAVLHGVSIAKNSDIDSGNYSILVKTNWLNWP